MPTKSTEDMKWIKEVAPFVFVETIAESNVLEISARHLRLVRPLASRKTPNRKVSVDGNQTEAQTTVEFVGNNGVKYVIDAILHWTTTDQIVEKVLTMHTQIFASRSDTIPASTDLRTIILDYINGTPESNCRWDELCMTVVDENGVHKSPVARCKTFL
jgi:hypothetical protein